MPWNLSPPIESQLWKPLEENPLPFAGLVTSLYDEHDYEPTVEGRLPAELRGTLYRNGPGLFDRGSFRKRMVLDGDGLVQALRLGEGKSRYRCRYVRTPKYERETSANHFLYPTWSTLSPAGLSANWGGKIPNQAGITVGRWGDRLLVFDENQIPYDLDPETLETRGEARLDPEAPHTLYTAHFKVDFRRRELIHFSVKYGRRVVASVVVLDEMGRVKSRHVCPMPRPAYMHDWLVTDRHFIFVLHPASVSLRGLLSVLAGRRSYADVVEWKPELGNLVAIFPRDVNGEAPRVFEAETRWMWHGMNAFEENGELVADFVASETGGGLGQEDSPLFLIMKGQVPKIPSEPLTEVHRYRIPLSGGKLREERLAREWSYEMPSVNPHHAGYPSRFGYLAAARPGELFWSAVIRLDTQSGRSEAFDFGPGLYASEPTFAPRPGYGYEAAGVEPGWLLTEVYDGSKKRSFVAVLDAERLADGPLAKIWLRHHVPLSFHGQWQPGL